MLVRQVKHICRHICIQLTQIFMFEFVIFKLRYDIAMKQTIIKYQINEVVLALLLCYCNNITGF